MKQEPDKRIVSKGRYVLTLGVRTGMGLTSGGLCFLGFVCAGLALIPVLGIIGIVGLAVCIHHIDKSTICIFTAMLTTIVVLCVAAYGLFRGSKAVFTQAEKIDPGIPLTRANTAYLPYTDSLVRASEEPLQAQQSVLLRAATQSEQTSHEQLVWPAGSQEQP